MAHFALDNIDQAIRSFMGALTIVVEESASRAKLLNNLGVAHVHNGNNVEALKLFTSALEIQRQWLDGPVRRESIVYDAAITLGNMGKVYLDQSDYDLAYYVFEEACLVSFRFCMSTRSDTMLVRIRFLTMPILRIAPNDYVPQRS